MTDNIICKLLHLSNILNINNSIYGIAVLMLNINSKYLGI